MGQSQRQTELIAQIAARRERLFKLKQLMEEFWQALEGFCQKEYRSSIKDSSLRLKAKLMQLSDKTNLNFGRWDEYTNNRACLFQSNLFKPFCSLMKRN